MTTPALRLIPTDKIVPHPDNPRVVLREDVIGAIVANMNGEYPQKHAVHVRPRGDVYQLLAGHQRTEAAKRKGLKEVWAWVEDMDDPEAFMELVTSNNQGELDPIELGLHVFESELVSQGKKGAGLKVYAARVGKSPSYVTEIRQAGEVLASLRKTNLFAQANKFFGHAKHLCAIHDLPKLCWHPACEWLAANDKVTVKDVEARVEEAKEFSLEFAPGEEWSDYLPLYPCTSAVFCGTDPGNFRRLLALAAQVAEHIQETEETLLAEIEADKTLNKEGKKARSQAIAAAVLTIGEQWRGWLISNTGGESWDIAEVQKKRLEIEQALWDLSKKPAPEKVDLILADPPWQYDFAQTDNRQVENQYPTATVEEIESHINAQWAPPLADNCVLFLWATAPKLPEALRVMEAWGFTYKTHAVWDKEKIGMGYWFRGQHELLLVGTRGECSPPEQERRVASVFREARGKHSEKPECVYAALESMFPDAVRAEFYQRSAREGWKGFGNEAKE